MRNNKSRIQRRSSITIISKLLSLIGSLTYVIFLAVINGSIGHTVAIFIPLIGALTLAKICGATVALSYSWLFAIIIGFGLLRGVLRYFEQYSNHLIAFKLLAKIRNIIFTKLRVLCPAKLESKQKGSIISMITADTETIEVFYAHTVSPVCIAIIASLAIILFVGFIVNWYMAIFVTFAYIIVGIVLPIFSSRTTAEAGLNYRKKFTAFNGYFMDAIKGSRDIILHGQEDSKLRKVENFTNELIITSAKLKNKTLSISVLTTSIIIVLNLLMLVLGLLLTRYANLSVSLMFVGVVALMSSYGPVLAIAALPSNLSQTFASADRLITLLEEKPVVTDIANGMDIDFENLQVVNLGFAYGSDKTILNDVNIEVKCGEIIGIMGKSGYGKSTLLKLLLRFWKKDKGYILYNGTDIEEINTQSLKSNVVMVSQTTYLLDDTIKGNMRIANQKASDEQIVTACKKAGIHDFICTLKDGYDTKVGSINNLFSAGETQRIGLARVFLSDAKLILLDEPTSNVDAINEGIILKALAENKANKAFILVSHRESTMSIADRVYHFD